MQFHLLVLNWTSSLIRFNILSQIIQDEHNHNGSVQDNPPNSPSENPDDYKKNYKNEIIEVGGAWFNQMKESDLHLNGEG